MRLNKGTAEDAAIDTPRVDAAVREMMEAGEIPGAAVALVFGDATYVQGYGVREKGKKDPVTPETLFANASTTKAFTTTAMALLVDEGKMAWDDPVRKYLPSFRLADPHADALVTLRDLVCHRTGLPRHDMLWYHSDYDRAEILRRIGSAKLAAPFRSLYQYQNICYMAAGEAVRAASGASSFEAFAHNRLLTLLGMASTNFSSHDAERAANHAEPHQRRKGKVVRTPYLNFDNVGPCGSMNSCASDMLAWLRFQLAGGLAPDGTRLLSEANLRETHTAQMVVRVDDDTRARYPHLTQMSYGLGWSLWNYRDGYGVVSHSGAIDGFRAHVALIPEKKIGVALFLNLSVPAAELMRNALFDVLLGLPPGDWGTALKTDLKKADKEQKDKEKERREQRKKGREAPLSLSAFVGDYEDPSYGTVAITKHKKEGLALRWNRLDSPLRHQTFTTFLTTADTDTFGEVEVTFDLSAAGEIAGLRLFDGHFTRAAKSKPKEGDAA
jgi:CubicO group peptidase (beta-lactamase class C family)